VAWRLSVVVFEFEPCSSGRLRVEYKSACRGSLTFVVNNRSLHCDYDVLLHSTPLIQQHKTTILSFHLLLWLCIRDGCWRWLGATAPTDQDPRKSGRRTRERSDLFLHTDYLHRPRPCFTHIPSMQPRPTFLQSRQTKNIGTSPRLRTYWKR